MLNGFNKAMEQEVNHQITAVTIVDEYRDRERRKFSMVIYIVSESGAEREIKMISLLLLKSRDYDKNIWLPKNMYLENNLLKSQQQNQLQLYWYNINTL